MTLPKLAKTTVKNALLLVAPAVLAGCGLGNYVYPGVDRSQAAVIENTVDSVRHSAIQAILISVDGKEANTDSFVGGPIQVFIAPGKHILRVTCSYNTAMNIASDYRQTLTLNLKSGFVYRLVSKPLNPQSLGGPCKTEVKAFPRQDT